MRIQHNIMAMNAYRNYNTNTKALSGNLEKLSSGYKINRAGDDAAGLAISEKMRAQITGLDAAQKNVKDGISLVKTAEGAMQEIQDMLNRMDYLATQSANGTYQDEVDRENLQKEVESLKTEINRIADSANFNGIKLLDGSLGAVGGSSSGGGSGETVSVAFTTGGTGSASTPTPGTIAGVIGTNYKQEITLADATTASTNQILTIGIKGTDGKISETTLKWTADATTSKIATGDTSGLKAQLDDWLKDTYGLAEDGVTAAYVSTVAAGKITIDATDKSDNNIAIMYAERTDDTATPTLDTVEDATPGVSKGNNAPLATAKAGDTLTVTTNTDSGSKKQVFEFVNQGSEPKVKGATAIYVEGSDALDADAVASVAAQLKQYGVDVTIDGTTDTTLHFAEKSNAAAAGKGGLTLQIGDTADSFNQMKVIVGDMHTKAMGIAGVDIGDQDGAAAAIQTIKDAINYVSSVRGDLGAVQNRLEHTGNNLSVMAENIQDAESTIRDTDVANEMMSYVKNNILVQSAQAMLAQANQVPQGVLQLLG